MIEKKILPSIEKYGCRYGHISLEKSINKIFGLVKGKGF